MRRLFWLTAALIAYGSVFPFDFGPAAGTLARDWNAADVLQNIVLFLPLGYFGAGRPWLTLALAAVLGFGLQVVQLWLPSRDPNLTDGVANVIGAALGVLAGRVLPVARLPRGVTGVPAALVACWLAFRLMPFVPVLDVQEIKDSLKPLLKTPDVRALDVFHDATAWLVVAHLLGRKARWLGPLVAAVFGAEVLIVRNVVTASNVAGAALAVALTVAGLARRKLPLAGLVAAAILLAGLAPFVPREQAAAFSFVPFHGFLGGNILVNVANVFEKCFFYGSLVWLLSGAGLAVAALAAVLLTGAVEVAQVWFDGHTPEITDPLLALGMAYAIRALYHDAPDERAAADPGPAVR